MVGWDALKLFGTIISVRGWKQAVIAEENTWRNTAHSGEIQAKQGAAEGPHSSVHDNIQTPQRFSQITFTTVFEKLDTRAYLKHPFNDVFLKNVSLIL